jgi:hypothetical protein
VNFGNYPLRNIPAPHAHDVLCGRGGGTNNHVGNSHWRMLVAANKQLYVTLPKRQKMLLSRSIVNAVRSQNPPGRFLQKEAKSDLWYDVGDQRAQEKTSQALREGAPDIRSKISKTDLIPTEDSTYDSNGVVDGVPSPSTTTSLSPPLSKPVSVSATPYVPPPLANANAGPLANAGARAPANAGAPAATPANAATPPGSTPVMVYAMPQNGMPGMPMYQAMMTPQGVMVPNSMQPQMQMQPQGMVNSSMQGSTRGPMQGMAPAFPQPVPPQGPSPGTGKAKIGSTGNAPAPSDLMPPPANQTPTAHQLYQQAFQHQPPAGTASAPAPASASAPSLENRHNFDQEAAALMTGALEPSGLSFGSVSMMSVGNGKLEPGGLSFGSMMSYSVANSRAPDMVDGGLEPIGTSFGSLSLNSTDRSHLENALNATDLKQAPQASFMTPTFLSQQRSKGDLLECSDTESEDEEEEPALNQASKSAEWEKLKEMLQKHTKMEQHQAAQQHQAKHTPTPIPQPSRPLQPLQQHQFDASHEALPETGFYENISALSMGDFGEEDFDNLSPVQIRGIYDNGADAMPPPSLPLRTKNENGEAGISEREQLEMMYLAQGGGMNFSTQQNYGNGNGR